MEAREPSREEQGEKREQNDNQVNSYGSGKRATKRGGIGLVRELIAEVGGGPVDGEDGGGDGDGLGDGGDRHEGKVGSVIAQADIIAEPRAVMIEASNTIVTRSAMTSPRRAPNTTSIAKLDGDRTAMKGKATFPDGGKSGKRRGYSRRARDNARIGSGG